MFNDQLFISDFTARLNTTLEYARAEVVNLRGGKPSPTLVENLAVDAYQGQSKLRLMELATINVEGASGLLIIPFDPSTIKDIEKAILTSPLSISPRTEGQKIHLKFPAVTEEQRLKFFKIVSQKIEEGRVKIRAIRDEFRKKLKQGLENKDMSEDQKFRLEKELDKITAQFNEKLTEIRIKKEKEIMEV